jgi:hypothetical protein
MEDYQYIHAFFAALRNGFNTLKEDLSFLTAFTATMYFLSQVRADLIKKFILSKPSG